MIIQFVVVLEVGITGVHPNNDRTGMIERANIKKISQTVSSSIGYFQFMRIRQNERLERTARFGSFLHFSSRFFTFSFIKLYEMVVFAYLCK